MHQVATRSITAMTMMAPRRITPSPSSRSSSTARARSQPGGSAKYRTPKPSRYGRKRR
jgi:hypothetical protein